MESPAPTIKMVEEKDSKLRLLQAPPPPPANAAAVLAKKEKMSELQAAPPPPSGKPHKEPHKEPQAAPKAAPTAAPKAEPEPEPEPEPEAPQEEPPPTPTPTPTPLPPNVKILKGTRVINDTTYDFTLTAHLNLDSPLDSQLSVHCVSEYFDDYYFDTTAKDIQKHLIQLYPFDAENYQKSTQYVIHHSLKVFTITTDTNQLTIVDSPATGTEEEHTKNNGALNTLTVPDHATRGATVMQARARGMLQRKKDQTHGVVTVEFSTGSLGIELIDRPGKYGASIYAFQKDENGEHMAAEQSNLLERKMVVLRVGDKETIGEDFQTVLSMIRTAQRPMTMQFAYKYSKVLQLADNHWKLKRGPRAKRRKSTVPRINMSVQEGEQQQQSAIVKILKGSRVIHDETYDFTCTCELNLNSPLESVLTVECISEYYDENNRVPLVLTARDAQERLIALYPFDRENYSKSTKYVIHHVLKILDIDENSKTLRLCDPLQTMPKHTHTPIKTKEDDHEPEPDQDQDQQAEQEENNMGMLMEEEDTDAMTTAGPTRPMGPFWQAWVPEQLVKGATVIQSRARGMIQRRKDKVHGIVNVDFSEGALGLELENRKNKYGCQIIKFTRDAITGAMLPAELSGLLEIGMVLVRIGEETVVDKYFSECLVLIKQSKRPISFTFAYPKSKALSNADFKFGKRDSKITKTLRKEVNDAKRIKCQEDLMTGEAKWESFVWLGFDSYKMKAYSHAVEYLKYGLEKRMKLDSHGGHAGIAGNPLDMGYKFWKVLSSSLLWKWKRENKGSLQDMKECQKCYQISLGYLENASNPSVWNELADVYIRHGSIHNASKILIHLLNEFPRYEHKQDIIWRASLCFKHLNM